MRPLLLLMLMSSVTIAQIRHDTLVTVSPTGDFVGTPLVFVRIQLTSHVSLCVIAAETSRPDSVDVCFASEYAEDLRNASIFVEKGSDIRFPKQNATINGEVVFDSISYVSVRMPLLQFESLCSQSRFQIRTSDYNFTFGEDALLSLNELKKHLVNWPNEESTIPPRDFIEYDVAPTITHGVKPRYPQEALRKQLEGNVFLKLWINKLGRVRKIEVLKSDNDIFIEPAMEAAAAHIFTPAYLNGRPIEVWVALPFRFRVSTH